MSIQSTLDRPATRRDRRATSHCDIWDLIAPDLPCPACDTDFTDRLERATLDRGEDEDAFAVEEPVADDLAAEAAEAPEAMEIAEAVVTEQPAAHAHTRTDARAQASELLSLLAH